MKLDKYWKYDRSLVCPFCHRKKLWEDTHDEQDATHYCKKCKQGIAITGNCEARGVIE
jgi:transcription elongation factor Elf1